MHCPTRCTAPHDALPLTQPERYALSCSLLEFMNPRNKLVPALGQGIEKNERFRIVAKTLIHFIQPESVEFFHCEVLRGKVTTRIVILLPTRF
jgi:hypothetical protein